MEAPSEGSPKPGPLSPDSLLLRIIMALTKRNINGWTDLLKFI
jgi:hypothetical protein